VEHSLDIVKDRIPYRLRVTHGTIHAGPGGIEVRPEGRTALNCAQVRINVEDDLEARITRLNELMDRSLMFEGARVTIERLHRKHELVEAWYARNRHA